jgi:hypothetical protein
VRSGEVFPGVRAHHHVDVAVLNGTVTAVAKVLPITQGSERDLIVARALLIDASIDLADEVVKLGVYEDPPPERADMLEETRSLLDQLGAANVELIPRQDFVLLEARFSLLFFPDHK